VKVLKSLTPFGVALAIGAVPLTLSTTASAAHHVAPPNKSYCAPFVNNVEALGSGSVFGNIPLTATPANGSRMNTYLTNYVKALGDLATIFRTDVTNAHTPSRKALLLATINELHIEITHVQTYSKTVQLMVATKNSALLRMANSDVAVDANKSCLVWGQQLIVGFVFAENIIGQAQDGPLPGEGPNATATSRELRLVTNGYRGLITVKILKSTPKNGTLRSAEIAVTESKYTVDVCLKFSGKSRNDYEAFHASVC
jgi:hypothetical protein